MAIQRSKKRVSIGLLLVDRMATVEVVRGMRDYAAEQAHWDVIAALYPRAGAQLVTSRKLDGVFFGGDHAWLSVVGELNMPMVNFDYDPSVTGCPRVILDDMRVVDLVIEHFRERQLPSIAFLGYNNSPFSLERERCYRGKLPEIGGRPRVFTRSIRNPGAWMSPALGNWLARLPKPIGLFLCHDRLAYPVIEACRQRDIAIPQDVAMVGVDNAAVHCELIRPTVSSVMYPHYEIGWEAASLLDRMIAGEKPPGDVVRVPPPGIVTRTSSDVQHFGDPFIAEALAFIRRHAAGRLSVDDVLSHMAVSRSALERSFRRVLNTTPLHEIHRAKVTFARNLLLQTKLPMTAIADRAGFRNASHLSIIFKKITGQTPSAFRAEGSRLSA